MREVIKKSGRYIRIPDNWHDERIKDIRAYFEERGYVAIFVHHKDVAYIPDLLLYSDTEEPHLIWVEVCDAHNLGKRKRKHLKNLMEKVKGKLIRYFKNYEREHEFDPDILL
jgi:hypothetical protein